MKQVSSSEYVEYYDSVRVLQNLDYDSNSLLDEKDMEKKWWDHSSIDWSHTRNLNILSTMYTKKISEVEKLESISVEYYSLPRKVRKRYSSNTNSTIQEVSKQ